MEDKINKMLNSQSYAVAGSFRSKSKYAYRILLDLLKSEKKVYPVNPRGSQVEGLKCYQSVLDIPEIVDVVSIVTPPLITENIVFQCRKKGIKNVWMQPGAESRKAIDFCLKNNINVIYNACLFKGKKI